MVIQSQPRFALLFPKGRFAEPALTVQAGDTIDSLQELALADAADRTLLMLVMCAALATLALALASLLLA